MAVNINHRLIVITKYATPFKKCSTSHNAYSKENIFCEHATELSKEQSCSLSILNKNKIKKISKD